ncbi:MAG: hypothetical protein EOM10_10795, partial [Opitutae bacterium]|nr:hypothetical protein [Opitutae bacterium]
MSSFRLMSFPIDQIDNLNALEQRLGQAIATLPFPMRLLVLSRPFDMSAPISRLSRHEHALVRLSLHLHPLLQHIQAFLRHAAPDPGPLLRHLPPEVSAEILSLLAHDPPMQRLFLDLDQAAPDHAPLLWAALHDALAELMQALTWRTPLLQDLRHFYTRLQQHQVRTVSFILHTWEPPSLSPTTLARTLEHALGRPVTILEQLPSILPGTYEDCGHLLAPSEPGLPYFAGALAYDVRGTWDATTLHDLLADDGDIALAIDIQTYPRHTATRMAEFAYNAARVAARDPQTLDLRAERVMQASTHILAQLVHQALHSVQIAALVSAPTPEAVEQQLTALIHRGGSHLRLFRPPHGIRALIHLWSGTPRDQIAAPFRPQTMLSQGVGCCFGVLGYHRPQQTRGVCWGVEDPRGAPLFFDLFHNRQAAHTVVIGKSGFGKSFFLNLLSMRSALEGYRVIGIDAFQNGQRLVQATNGGARCYPLRLTDTYNPLDILFTDEHWLASQVAQAQRMLALILGRSVPSTQGQASTVLPRVFTEDEESVLDLALTQLYRPLDPQLPRAEMPLLSDLVTILHRLGEPEATALARSLRLLLTETSRGQRFNGPTSVDWRFEADLSFYDLFPIPPHQRILPSLLFLDGVLQFMRDPQRDLSRPTLLLIDEFGYLARMEAFARVAAEISKVARKYSLGLVAVDQSPQIFLDSPEGKDIFDNARARVLFRMDAPAQARIEAFARVAAEISKVARKYSLGLVAVDQSPQIFLDSPEGKDIFDNARA